MAIAGFESVTFAGGDCVDMSQFRTLLANQKALAAFAALSGGRFECRSVSRVLTGGLGEELCTTFRADSISAGVVDQKVLSLVVGKSVSATFNTGTDSQETFQYSNLGPEGGLTLPDQNAREVRVTGTLKCGDETVWTGDINDTVDISFDCPRNAVVEFCLSTEITGGGIDTASSAGTITLELCGGLLCVQPFTNDSLQDFFCPPCIPDCAKPGREVLALIDQNSQALCRYFQASSQVRRYEAFTFNDIDDHPLLINAQVPTSYWVIGQVDICVELSGATEGDFQVAPFVGCVGNEAGCITKSANVDPEFGVRTACIKVKIKACGNCEIGDTLTAGLLFAERCSGVPDPLQSGNVFTVTSVTQSYCLFAFEEVPLPELGISSRPDADCISAESLQALNDKLVIVEENVCDRTPLVAQTVTDQKVLGGSETVTIAAAATPPVPLPPDWPYDRRFDLIFDAQFCLANNIPTIPLEDAVFGRAEIEIRCGGTLLKTLGPYVWKIAESGRFQRCSPRFCDVCCNIICPADEDLTVTMNATIPGFGSPEPWEIDLICQQIGFI